jgi:DNA-binding GntR family transcriptional regulator
MQRIDFTNTKDEVAEIIKREIISGNITNQHTITQHALAEQFGLSRMPIREAFNTLIQEGLIIKLNNRKLEVIEINANTLTLYNEMLSSIEVSLLMHCQQDQRSQGKNICQSIVENLWACENDKQNLVSFHRLISEITGDTYTRHFYLNTLNTFWAHSIQYCSPNYRQSLIHIESALTLLLSQDKVRQDIKSEIISANRVILDAIAL